MDISLLVGHGEDTLDLLVGHAQTAEECGLKAAWYGQHLSYDSPSVALYAATQTSKIGVGSAVVPTYPRHPIALASQAHTVQIASGGRFRLGIGVSHKPFIEQIHGLSQAAPARHLREYLTVLRALLDDRQVSFEGEFYNVHAQMGIAEPGSVPVFAAALGPRSLAVCGELADGVVTYLAGPRTLQDFVVPRLSEAAADAGRPSPQVVASVPVILTDDPETASAIATEFLGFHTQLDAYRQIVEREQIESPVELAIIGDESVVRAGLREFGDAGVTEFAAAPFGSPDQIRATCELLGEIQAETA